MPQSKRRRQASKPVSLKDSIRRVNILKVSILKVSILKVSILRVCRVRCLAVVPWVACWAQCWVA